MVSPFSFSFYGYSCTSVIMIEVVGEVTLGQIKNPSFKTGIHVSSAESERFELSQDCYTLTD